MKCLAVGMNPKYVLSEDERRRRFKKRNNSINNDEKTNVVPVIRSLTMNKPVKNKPHNEETSQTQKSEQILDRHEENYCPSQVTSSTENNVADTEIKY